MIAAELEAVLLDVAAIETKVATAFLRNLMDRGLCTADALLVVIDGGKGLPSLIDTGDRRRRKRHYSEALYDLATDPGETTNVIAKHGDVAGSPRSQIWSYLPMSPPPSDPLRLDKRTRQRSGASVISLIDGDSARRAACRRDAS